MHVALIFIGLFAGSLSAQPKHCAHFIQQGDTTICQQFNDDGTIDEEDFYRQNKRLFTRFWRYGPCGYGWKQYRKNIRSEAPEGPARTYFPDGKIQTIANFHAGVQVGECRHYYHSGMLQLRCNFAQDGELDGIRLTYHENGQVESKTRWISGRMRDILRYKDDHGRDLETGSFKWGNGDWIWYKNGRPTYRLIFKNGFEIKTVDLRSETRGKHAYNILPTAGLVEDDANNQRARDTIPLANPSFEANEPQAATVPNGWIDIGVQTETPPDLQPGYFEVSLPAQDGQRYVGLVVRESNSCEGIGQHLDSYLSKDSTYAFSLYLTRSQKYMSATRTSPETINFNAPTILKIWGYNTRSKQEELLAETTAVSHSEWTKYSFLLKPTLGDFDELDLMAGYAPGFEKKNGNLLMDNCSSIVPIKN